MAAVTPIDIIANALLVCEDPSLDGQLDNRVEPAHYRVRAERVATAVTDEQIIRHALAEVRSRPATRWVIEDLDDQELCTVLRVAFGSIANLNQETPTP